MCVAAAVEMNLFWAVLLLGAGLGLLFKSADWLVTGAVSLAEWFGIRPLVIGLTVVAMGTSSPEVAASIAAALRGIGDVSIGNVYGSNIANLALVGGLVALIRPLAIQRVTLRREIPVMLLSGLLLWPVLTDQHLGRIEGLILLGIFAVLIGATVYLARREAQAERVAVEVGGEPVRAVAAISTKRPGPAVFYAAIGLAGLALGADICVRGAVYVGGPAGLGLSEAVIGLTIVAVGTSLPELMTCVVAALRGQDDISVGNLVGSNVFNTLLVVGTAGTVRPFGIAARLVGADYWIMILITAGFIAFALPRGRISRRAGVLLLAGYVSYICYLLIFGRAAG